MTCSPGSNLSNLVLFCLLLKQQTPHLISLKEEVTDVVRVKKKYVKKKHKTSECIVLHPQPSTESQPPLRDIKQYDFLSSDEESYTQVPSFFSKQINIRFNMLL